MAKSSYKKIFIPSYTEKKKKKKVLLYRIQNMNKYLTLLLEQPYATVKYIEDKETFIMQCIWKTTVIIKEQGIAHLIESI